MQIPPGTCRTTAQLTVTSGGITITGSGALGSKIYLDSATATVLFLNGGVGGISGVHIRDLTLDSYKMSDSTRTAGNGLNIVNVGDFSVRNTYIYHPWIGIACGPCSTGIFDRINIIGDANVTGGGLSIGLVVGNGAGGTTTVENYLSHIIVSSTSPFTAGLVLDSGVDTLSLKNFSVTGQTAFKGISFANNGSSWNPRWIRGEDIEIEPATTTGTAIDFDKVTDAEFHNVYTAQGKNGLHFTANAKSVQVVGGIVQVTQQYGVVLDGGTHITLANLLVTDSGQNGVPYDNIVNAGATHLTITGCRAGNIIWNGTGGFVATAGKGFNQVAGDNVIVSGNDFVGGYADSSGVASIQVYGNLPTTINNAFKGALTGNGTINALTGYQVNGAATTGNALRGNGTNFVSAQLALSDLSGANSLTKLAKYTASLSPAIVAANTCAEQIFTVTGVSFSPLDVVTAVNKPTAQAGLSIGGYRVSSADHVAINFCNNTGADITPTAAETYSVAVLQ